MKQSICLISMLYLAAAAVVMGREASAADIPQIDLTEWTPPSIDSVGDDPFGKLVHRFHGTDHLCRIHVSCHGLYPDC